MKEYTKDTSQEYEDLVGYVASDNLPVDLGEFIDDATEYKPKVEAKKVNPDFPEPWQSIYVNFNSLEEYADFMKLIGFAPAPKLKELVYTSSSDTYDITSFFGG